MVGGQPSYLTYLNISKDMAKLTIRCNKQSDYAMLHHHVAYKVIILFRMLCSFMKNKIISYAHNNLIITIHHHQLIADPISQRKD